MTIKVSMVNKKGGKAYKKGKHTDEAPEFIECMDGQLHGRVLKVLGNCRVIVYCNDDERRICHIRGAIRRRVWIEPGDVVLVSTREFELHSGEKEDMERGDVLAKFDLKHQSKLKKEPGFNLKLLCELEKIDFDSGSGQGLRIQAMMGNSGGVTSGGGAGSDPSASNSKIGGGAADVFEDAGFEFDRGGDSEGDDHADEDDSDSEGDAAKPNFAIKQKALDMKRNTQRLVKNSTDDIDIDAI